MTLAELDATAAAHEILGQKLAFGLHQHLLDAYTKWLKDVERELKSTTGESRSARNTES